jgi:ABC-type uncharacterized transport system involved in gliding motility auxiliary subunit/ABC-type transport system involved in cytochrome c biogenesis permease component
MTAHRTPHPLRAVCAREILSLLAEPWWLLILPLMTGVTLAAAIFAGDFFLRGQADGQSLWPYLPWVLAMMAPVTAMRGWADDKRRGILEWLRATPVPLWAWILGRWLVQVLLGAVFLVLLAPFFMLLAVWGNPDWGPIILALVAAWLLWAVFAAIAQAVSACCRQPLTALCAGWAICGLPLILPRLLGEKFSVFGLGSAWQAVVDGLLPPGLPLLGAFYILAATFAALWALSDYRLRPRQVLVFAALLAILLSLLPMADRYGATLTWDVTADKRHTLAPVTQNLLMGLDENIRIDLFYSPELTALSADYAALLPAVRRLVRQYRATAQGRIEGQEIAVDPAGDLPEELRRQGLAPIPLFGGTQNAFLGLIVRRASGPIAAIPQFVPQRAALLEYDLTALMQNLLRPARPKIGVLTGLPLMGDFFSALADGSGAPVPWLIWLQLQDHYELLPIKPGDKKLPDDLSALLLIQPPALRPELQQALESFLLANGRAVIITDPLSEAQLARQLPGQPPPAIPADFAAWQAGLGIRIDSSRIVADPKLAQRVVLPRAEAVKSNQAVDYAPWLRWQADAVPPNSHPAVQSLRQVNLASAGSIDILAKAATAITPLLQTTAAAGTLPRGLLWPAPELEVLAKNIQPAPQPLNLAVSVQGPWRLGGKASANPAQIIWIADGDWLEDRFWVQIPETVQSGQLRATANNADFLLNALDYVLGDPALAGIRSREILARPLQKLIDRRRAAEVKWLPQIDAASENLRRLSADVPPIADRDATRLWQTEQAAARQAWRKANAGLQRDIAGWQNRITLILLAGYPFALTVLGGILLYWYGRRRTAW